MRDQYTRASQGFILVYNIASRSTFDELETFRCQICRVKDKDKVPMVLVGNLENEPERQVSTVEGEELAKLLGCPFFECPVKTSENVDEIFFALVREIRKDYSTEKKETTKKKGLFDKLFKTPERKSTPKLDLPTNSVTRPVSPPSKILMSNKSNNCSERFSTRTQLPFVKFTICRRCPKYYEIHTTK
jgi:GTPase SAR1 family protein